MQLFEILPKTTMSNGSNICDNKNEDKAPAKTFRTLEGVHLCFSTKAMITTFTGADGMSITGGYHQLNIDAQLKKEKNDSFDISSHAKLVGFDVNYTYTRGNSIPLPLVRPTQINLEVNAIYPVKK